MIAGPWPELVAVCLKRAFTHKIMGPEENYAKVAVLCSRCGELLAVYRKRNARKSQLVLA